MKIETNKVTQAPSIKIDENDAAKMLDLRTMINGFFMCSRCGESNANHGWEFLKGYFASYRLWVEERGKANARSRAKRDLCSNDFSVLEGMDRIINLPDVLVKQADMLDEIRERKLLELAETQEESEE